MTNLMDDWLPSTLCLWKIETTMTTNLGIFKGDNLAMNGLTSPEDQVQI